ncbi:NAD(P)-binding protein [Pseudovirgaria hyperparasitica]|uniref:NAD(P)-binding protein n=1 Tax=Pseudovirgaria hyperparasitica TaxID=470096 RepID=A0A6A6VZN5_9PEZI|nr:NAD(P)-binding protein [Pseudovirgaria hyperparasitica]KAF2756112.1 NAD(P)-binding protein [Pseudovirgaria hyperparasitica]
MTSQSTPSSSLRLQGKVAIVTGASSGLGRAIALAYSVQGALVTCADLKPTARPQVPDELNITTHELIQERGGQAIFVEADVTKTDQVEELVKRTVATWGRLDILVNNAGIAIEARERFRLHETPESTWDQTLAVNAKSVFLASKFALQQMLEQEPSISGERGCIINMSSIYGLVGGSFVPSYAASKGAVSLLTMQIANDYSKDGIRCNAICPGHTRTAIFEDTEKYQMSKEWFDQNYPTGVGKPEDIAGMAVFLASDDARWVTGTRMPVDGGFTAR